MNVTSYLERSTDRITRKRDYRQLVRQYYDSVTLFYHKGWGEHFHFAPFRGDEPVQRALEAQQALLARRAQIRRGQRVLDVGCGIGGPGRNIARRTGAHVTGVTISPEQVRTAQGLIRKQGLEDRCQVLLGDAMQLDQPDASFDVVLAIESACHMPDKRAFYAECARVLTPGGRLAGWDWIDTAPPHAGEARTRHLEPICAYFALPGLSTLEEIGSHLRAAGLEVLSLEDLAPGSDPARPWYAPLEQQLSGTLTRIASRLSETLMMMQHSGELLVEAGRAGVFSPLGFFVAEKPC
jgi:sterol 24-C-methyltransferase